MSGKKQLTLKFVSETIPWSGTAGAFAQFGTAWLPKRGPMGGRIVIDAIQAVYVGTATVAGAVIQGEDVYRFFGPTTVKQKDGYLRYNEVPGDAMRAYLFECYGAARVKEHADVAIAAPATVTATMMIPLAKPNMKEPGDYSLAAEELEFVRIRCATSSDLTLGGSTVTVLTGDYYLIFECHEELDVVVHAIDEVKIQDFSSTTAQEDELKVGGRLQELIFTVRGAEGGASLANLTAAWIHQPQWLAPELQVSPDLKEYFGRERGEATSGASATGAANSTSPYTSSTTRAVAVLMATGTKCFDGPEIDSAIVKATHTLGATIRMIARVAKKREESTVERIRRSKKLKGLYRVKTASNQQRAPQAWPADVLPYLPLKFVE